MAQPTRSSKFCALVSAFAFVGGACSSSALPESAAPKGELVESSSLEDADLVPYRKLTRDDFKGSKPPPQFEAVADRAGATTCARVVTSPELELEISGMQKKSGEGHYKSKVRKLSFRAFMDRSCSWWNDKVASEQPDYVLEHEQIHFAIFELGARQLNARAAAISRDMEGEGATHEELKQHALEVHEQAMRDALASIMKRSQEFDEDTSLGYQPVRQKAWLQQITRELADTETWAK